MRRILIADLVAAAHLLARSPATERSGMLDRLFQQTQAADLFTRRFGRPHPAWGNGSLLARALAEPARAGDEDHDFWVCVGLVALRMAHRRRSRHEGLGLDPHHPI